MKKAQIIIFIIISILVASCGIVNVTFPESKHSIKQAEQMSDFISLNADQIKEMIFNDTTHYKFVVFYQNGCGACRMHMIYTYPLIRKQVDSNEVKWYFILANTGGIKKTDKLLNSVGLGNITKYYLRDNNPLFSSKNDNQLNNLTNYIFDSNPKVNDVFGTPANYIISKDNKLKKSYYIYKNKDIRIHTTDMYDILGKSLQEINFDKIDSVFIDWEPYYCTDKSCSIN